MAKGYDQHKKRLEDLSHFAKDLVRRAGSCCELCCSGGVKLKVFEVPPSPPEPEWEHCILICEICKFQLENPKKLDHAHWRCLNKSIWSDIAPVQALSVSLLQKIATREDWARELQEQIYLMPEVEEWVRKIQFCKPKHS